MGCCPKAPAVRTFGSADSNVVGQSTDMRIGESVECYMNRAGNTTGRHDDKREDPPDRILNTDVPISGNATVNVQFELTPNSTRSATRWELEEGGSVKSTLHGVPFTSAGLLKGTFDASSHGKSIKIKVSAFDATGLIDARGFTFSPTIATGTNQIRFTHPLPGSRVTSRFGPRRPPKEGASSIHGGADFAYASGKVDDVRAAADGTVIFTGFQNGGAGNYVKIEHKNAGGKLLCTTVYMHLQSIYVAVGQRVSAGQKIGREGNTGVGTGPHLHFECRLPNGTKIDPVPLIHGSLDVALKTDPTDNSAIESSIRPQNSDAVLTDENVTAKVNGCEPFGPGYPPAREGQANDPLPPSTDPFERAWYITMKHEVGPHWSVALANQPDVLAGLIETPTQRRNCGYVNKSSDRGGETKFGISQNSNTHLIVRSITYETAKLTGFNNYWKVGAIRPFDIAQTMPKTAVMLFDMNYHHGPGVAQAIWNAARISPATPDDEALVALAAAREERMRRIVINNPQQAVFLNGWLARVKVTLAYAQSI